MTEAELVKSLSERFYSDFADTVARRGRGGGGGGGVAAVLALTMWRTGALTFVTDHGSDLQALLPTVQVTLPEKQPPKLLPEKLGRPVTSRPGENIYTRVSSVLESLLNAAENIKS